MRKSRIKVGIISLILSIAFCITSLAAGWQNDANGWWWQNTDGTWPVSSWQWLDGNNDGVAESYYFNTDGYLLMNTTTPDGYTVDANGAWIQNGIVQTKAIEGNNSSSSESLFKNSFISSKGQSINYYLFMPAEVKENMPLIVYLHSAVPNKKEIDLIKTEDMVTYLINGGKNTVPAYVLMPHAAVDSWDKYRESVKELIDQLTINYKIDVNKISIAGWSMGANALQDYVVKYPELFSCAVMISPYSNRREIRDTQIAALKNIPVWIIHETKGYSDTGSKNAEKELKAAGGSVKSTSVKDATHETLRIFPEGAVDTYGVIDWMISQ